MFTRSNAQTAISQAGEYAPETSQHSVSQTVDNTACSERGARSKSSRSSATIKAQKAALEALALRRRLEREQHLTTLQQQVDDSVLKAELAAIDADAATSRPGSCVSHSPAASRVSVDRTNTWVNNLTNPVQLSNVVKGITAVGIEENLPFPTSGRSEPSEPAAPRITASFNNVTESRNVQASEAAGIMPPLNLTDFKQQQSSLFIQAVADTAAAVKALASIPSSKKIELSPFSGNTLQWLHFRREYDITKHNFSPIENINRLQSALRGAAREAVAALLMSTEDPEEVMRALEDNFARPELIIHKEVINLKNLSRLGNELRELGTFTNRVRNSIATIKLLKQTEYLYSPELFHTILSKLNPTTKIRWTDFAMQDVTGRPKLEILSDFLKRELDQHIRFGLSPESSSVPHSHLSVKQKREHIHVLSHTKRSECVYCKKVHNIKDCSEFRSLSIVDRWQWLREAKICYRCLRGSSHQWKTCKVNPCGINGCTFRHHPLLHNTSPSPLVNKIEAVQIKNVNNCNSTSESNPCKGTPQSEGRVIVSATSTGQCDTISALRPSAYLKLIPVTVSGPAGTCDVYALLDDGSTATLIDSEIAARIGATGPQQSISVNGVGGLERHTTVSYIDFCIKGKHSKEIFTIKNAMALESLDLRPQTIARETIEKFPYLNDLVDELVYDEAIPTILIGADNWYLTINHEVRVGKRNEPVACRTSLGWTLYGVASSKTNIIEFVNHCNVTENSYDNLDLLIKEQYKIDSLGISKLNSLLSKQDQRAVDLVEGTAERLPSGRFQVGLPWRDNIQRVPDSFAQAMSRFLSLERRMTKEPDFAKAYENVMINMTDKGYAEECSPESCHANYAKNEPGSTLRLYLPHFGVFHPQKRKIRVVHDAAARNEGVSLNSLLLPGPDLLQSLLRILFGFRESRVAIMADIKEMFSQIQIREQDRDALRYLWRSDKSQPIKEFRMKAVIFGACCSPFIAQFIKNKNANEHIIQYPNAADAILHKHYMDDFIDSLDNIELAAQLAADVVTVHKAACFEMRGWVSNEPAALDLIPEELKAAQLLEIQLGKDVNNVRALGLTWNPTADDLGFRTGITEDVAGLAPFTKRKVLAQLMSVYDPLGLLGPVVVKGRILFQQAWRLNLGWDTELPKVEALKWLDWLQELASVASLRIPRWYAKASDGEPLFRELHILADASELAFACVAYWRLVYIDGRSKLVLIASKSRVSPLKPVSIPRLELQAALIASRLAITIKDSHRKKPVRTFFWTDSMTVLQWLRSDARSFKPFVAHRIGEILENSSVNDWRWVPTDLNVADDATRFQQTYLNTSHRWFCGPHFLLKSPEDWPKEPINVAPVRKELKRQPNELVGLTTVGIASPTPVTTNLSYFSDWARLLRATARVHQAALIFRNNLATSSNSKTYNTNHSTAASTTLLPLDADTIKAAERHILQRSQLDAFAEEFNCILNSKPIPRNSRLIKLSPALGEDILLHLSGRIKAVEDIDPDARFPILLDGRHPATQLLVQHYHRKAGHANNELVINEVRQRFWILHLRDTVRSVASKCFLCRVRKCNPMNPTTGDLPPQRMAHHRRPFTFTGVDYFGPILTTIGRRHEKRYVALYTCLTTRALHLELVQSLSADSAIMGLRRFVARRGIPDTIYSDNGTAFVGANRILKDFYSSDIQDFAATKGINWRFIPAAAPHFGGSWERLVRTVKIALKATLNERAPKEETLLTLLTEAEAIVNSRPLAHVSADPNDPTTLTPFHFLIGTSSNQALPKAFEDHDLVGRSEWKKALRLSDHFWNRWVREVLPTMQPRDLTHGDHGQGLQIGDMVLIADGALPRGTWPRGRVSAKYPGRDGVLRVVDVATAGGTLRRPLRKLVRLPN